MNTICNEFLVAEKRLRFSRNLRLSFSIGPASFNTIDNVLFRLETLGNRGSSKTPLFLFCCGKPPAGMPPAPGISKAGRQLLGSSYSREDELEADAFAVALVGTAGGDALAGERLLEELAQRVQSVGIAGDYFATHPPLVERVAKLRAKRQG